VDPTSPRTLDLRHYMRAVRAHARMVIAIAVILGLATGLYITLREPLYRAHTRVRVEPIVDPVLADFQGQAAVTIQPDMNTEIQLAQSRAIATQVQRGVPSVTEVTPQALLRSLTVDVVRDTTVLEFSFVSPEPLLASTVVNAFATAYLDSRRQQIAVRVEDNLDTINGRLEDLSRAYAEKQDEIALEDEPFTRGLLQSDAVNLSERIRELSAQQERMTILRDTSAGGTIVAPASVPERPTGPSVPVAAAMGVFLGALIGAAAAIGRQLVLDRVAGQGEIEEHLGAPVIGVIPAVRGWNERSRARLLTREDPASAVAEAYRTLGTNIRFAASQQPLEILMVTSSLPEEGKTATASNLALVLAQSGLRTILVDADLRRPRADKFLDVAPGPGLREALEGWRELVDVIQMSEVPGLAVLRSGETPQDPASLLSGPEVARVFSELRKAADIIVCDAPPVLPVADASIIAASVDGVLFVHDPGISPKTALAEAVRQLRTAGGHVIGGVHNNVTKSQRTYLGYAQYETYYGAANQRMRPAEGPTLERDGRTIAFPPRPASRRGGDLERAGRRERRS
jgi:succinoglycan biosynthesis transport protein ExoP